MFNTDGFNLRIDSLCIILSRSNRLWWSCVNFYIYFWYFVASFLHPWSYVFWIASLPVLNSLFLAMILELQLKILPTK